MRSKPERHFRVDEEVWKLVTNGARPGEALNDTLRRLLGMPKKDKRPKWQKERDDRRPSRGGIGEIGIRE